MDSLEEDLARVQDLVTARPATQEFLKSRGLTHVRELDAQGERDLTAYLEETLRQLKKSN